MNNQKQKQIQGYIAQNQKGEILWAGGATNDKEALSQCIDVLGEKEQWTLIQIRLVTRAVVHEHITVYTNDGYKTAGSPAQEFEPSFIPSNPKEYNDEVTIDALKLNEQTR